MLVWVGTSGSATAHQRFNLGLFFKESEKDPKCKFFKEIFKEIQWNINKDFRRTPKDIKLVSLKGRSPKEPNIKMFGSNFQRKNPKGSLMEYFEGSKSWVLRIFF